MSIQSTRRTVIGFTGDVTWDQTEYAADNALANGQSELKNLSAAFNQFTVPITGGTVPTAVTIIPPAGNAQTMILKGVTGDTGIGLHLTDPSTIALASTTTVWGITAGGTITGLRLIYS